MAAQTALRSTGGLLCSRAAHLASLGAKLRCINNLASSLCIASARVPGAYEPYCAHHRCDCPCRQGHQPLLCVGGDGRGQQPGSRAGHRQLQKRGGHLPRPPGQACPRPGSSLLAHVQG